MALLHTQASLHDTAHSKTRAKKKKKINATILQYKDSFNDVRSQSADYTRISSSNKEHNCQRTFTVFRLSPKAPWSQER